MTYYSQYYTEDTCLCTECKTPIPQGLTLCSLCWWIVHEASKSEINALIAEYNLEDDDDDDYWG